MTTKKSFRLKWLIILFAVYAAAVVIRFILALLTTSFPTVGIDEYLYYSLARSIATEGKLLFRGQSADYAYILYPLVLSPVYALAGQGTHIYRFLQLWNSMLMNASVFPIFLLSERMLKSEKRALIVTVLSLLLPDFILGELIFSEALIYPLFFTLIYFIYGYFTGGESQHALLGGFLGGLLYSIKPGAIVPAVVFLAAVLLTGILRKKTKMCLHGLFSAGILLVTAGVFFLLAKFGFGYEGSFLSIYTSQLTEAQGQRFGEVIKAIISYPFYFILSCGIIGFAVPAVFSGRWSQENRILWRIVLISLGVMMIGAAWAIEPGTTLNTIHMRYVAMYAPLILLFCLVPFEEKKPSARQQGKKHSVLIRLLPVLGFVVLFCLVFGCKVKAESAGEHAFFLLSVLNDRFLPLTKEWVGNGAVILLSALTVILILVNADKKELGILAAGIMSICFLLNGILGYSVMRENYYPNLEKDGFTILDLTEGHPYVYLLANEGIVDVGVDVNTRQNNCIVYTNDFINCLQKNNGVYTPYIPEQMRGMITVKETPEVDTLIIDHDSYPYFKLSSFASVQSPEGNSTAYVVRFEKGKRLVDCTLSNLTNHILSPGKPGIILIYNEEYYQKPVTFRLEIESVAEQTLTINSTHELYTLDLARGKAWYEVGFHSAEDAFNFTVPDAEIKVTGFEMITEG